jgi:hypothetical protein
MSTPGVRVQRYRSPSLQLQMATFELFFVFRCWEFPVRRATGYQILAMRDRHLENVHSTHLRPLFFLHTP